MSCTDEISRVFLMNFDFVVILISECILDKDTHTHARTHTHTHTHTHTRVFWEGVCEWVWMYVFLYT